MFSAAAQDAEPPVVLQSTALAALNNKARIMICIMNKDGVGSIAKDKITIIDFATQDLPSFHNF